MRNIEEHIYRHIPEVLYVGTDATCGRCLNTWNGRLESEVQTAKPVRLSVLLQ